ncbi:hypothetical protein IIM_04102 [Bacillus cereus VD107]|nr:hypothetical protein IIM_04102 [Bacillus cereus VD107]
MDKTLKNIIYVAIQQFVNTILPFLTIPYIARVLGVEQNGVYSYSLTIVNLFVVFFSFGFAVHGTNVIAQSKGDLQKIKYLEIQILRMLFLIIGLCIFILFITFYPLNNNKILFVLQGLLILVSFFDISWYYQGIGDFKKVVTRNISVKLIGTLSIFLFVKGSGDLWIYIILMNGSQLLGNMILFKETFSLFKYLKYINIKRFIPHIKISFFLFLPNISVLVYSSFDKILLGSTGDINGLSNYQQVQRIIAFMYVFLMIPSPVMIQKIAHFRSTVQFKQADLIIRTGLNMYVISGGFLIFGILLCSQEFINLFLGEEYYEAINLFILMSPVLIAKTVGGVIGGWYLVPLGRNILHSIPLVVGTAISIILNMLLTPSLGATTATLILVLTELTIIIIQLCYSKELYYFFDKKNILIFLLIFLFAFLIMKLLFKLTFINGLESIFLKLIIEIFTFTFLSLGLSYFIRSTRVFLKDIFNLFRKRER